MAASKPKSIDFFAHQFVICAGSVLFKVSDTGALTVCILHKRSKDEWCLPKGRKDQGETIPDSAVRETTEETGFPCALFPIDLRTRATVPGGDDKDRPRLQKLSTEPFAITIRHISDANIKMIYWFVTCVEGGASQIAGTQMPSESFEAVFFEPEDAMNKLTQPDQRNIVAKALELVKGTLSEKPV